MHRIRWATAPTQDGPKPNGTIEADETYVGGKPRRKGVSRRGRGTKKTPVLGLVERDGRVHTRVVCDVTSKTLKGAIREIVDPRSMIMTDENRAYTGIGRDFEGGHRSVKHAIGEYSRQSDGASTNTAESHFAIIKRGMYGTFHHVSKEHLQRYCDEFDFRWDRRKVDDVERTIVAIRRAEGKRLTYRPPAA